MKDYSKDSKYLLIRFRVKKNELSYSYKKKILEQNKIKVFEIKKEEVKEEIKISTD